MPVAVVVPRTTLQPETTGTCLAAAESGSFLFLFFKIKLMICAYGVNCLCSGT